MIAKDTLIKFGRIPLMLLLMLPSTLSEFSTGDVFSLSMWAPVGSCSCLLGCVSGLLIFSVKSISSSSMFSLTWFSV